jgi:hypothetical protein
VIRLSDKITRLINDDDVYYFGRSQDFPDAKSDARYFLSYMDSLPDCTTASAPSQRRDNSPSIDFSEIDDARNRAQWASSMAVFQGNQSLLGIYGVKVRPTATDSYEVGLPECFSGAASRSLAATYLQRMLESARVLADAILDDDLEEGDEILGEVSLVDLQNSIDDAELLLPMVDETELCD